MDAREKDFGRWLDMWCLLFFWPFPNSSGWWRLISSTFLTRTSCCKATHAKGYYGAWPGWVVSVSVLPLTVGWHHQFNGHEFEQVLGVDDGQGSLGCCRPRGLKESDVTERLNWTKLSRNVFQDCIYDIITCIQIF